MANIVRTGIFPADRVPSQELLFPVDSGNGANMFIGDVVSAVAAGAVNVASANDGSIVVGTVVELFDSSKRPVDAWFGGVSTKYLPASTAGYALVALALPGRRFIAQSDTILTSAAIFASTNHVAGSGSTLTGESGHTMNGGDLNTGAQLLILGQVNDPTNDITLANAHWYVSFNESIFMGVGKSVGV